MNDDPPTRRRDALRPWLLALALWLLLAAVTALALWHLHRSALSSQGREIQLLSLALTDELDRGLHGTEYGLQALGRELRSRHLMGPGLDTEQALHTRAALMPMVESLWLLGPERQLLAASDAAPLPALEGFLPALSSLDGDSTALSPSYEHPGGTQRLVALALRVDATPEHPGGWVLASMPTDKLLGAFGAALPAADARVAIFRRDGLRLVGSEVVAPRAAAPDNTAPLRLDGLPGLERQRFSDGSDNLVGVHEVERHGLQVMVSRGLGSVLAGWRGALDLALGALVFLLLVLAAAVAIVTRSERRRLAAQQALQLQLTRASKLEALGALAGGVSHDFNNVLAGIVGYGEMAQDAAVPGSDQARHLDRVLQAAQRGQSLIERILSVSRGGARVSSVFELEPIVEEVLTLLTASLRPGMVLERVLDAPDARLRGDATQTFEAVMNLCTNAMQAMPDGGMLTVQLERARVNAPRVLSHSALHEGDYLLLSVSDQGVGITPAVMERLFEPFFTARSALGGTGLGLAVVFGVVAELGGGIDVHSRPGQGARFSLYLPECFEPATEATEADTNAVVAAGAGQSLLVVDDEPVLLNMTAELLSDLGYDPVCFGDAAAALQAVQAHPARFAAVITDEVMPGLSGTQFTRTLREHAPDLPVLLVSGYGGARLARRASRAGVTRVLMKPLRRAELARTLAEMLT
ncbi:ATP-binding protein [Hydrogenophaga palleronii]|uniref:ATP-binding protein n=1 Tax=Hydrogenophaga palleronii TaxID=65655 RepID=UPI00082626C9|nr:ATP-binding protein [Hydrogenophaga palleronii]